MKKILMLIIALFMSAVTFGHAPLISIDDNNDGTIYIEGGFSNGASAEGVEIVIVKNKPYNGPEDTFKGKEIIFKGKLNSENALTIPKPVTNKYEVYFNAGEGHIIGKEGPILTDSEKENWKKMISEYDFGDWKEFMIEN